MADELVHVIDDDPAVRDSLAFLLETANLSPRTYDSAVDFLEALPEVTSGCVVTDVRMPEMTGIELVRRLKGQGFRLPIVMITGHATLKRIAEARDAGVNEFMAKPLTARGVLERLALVIDHPRPFIRSDDYFGPDRRRRHDPKYAGPWRRASDAGEIRSVEL